MSTPKDEVSALFRSLGSGAANPPSQPAALAQEAQQRWPLLQAIAPKAPAHSPALTDQEKARWTTPTPANAGGKKPALSRPGLGDKLIKGLEKMSGRSPAPAIAQAEPEIPAESKVQPARGSQTLLSAQTKTPRAQLFSTPPEEPIAAPLQACAPVAEDDTLAAIFGRLAQKDLTASPPPAKKSSFLSRIGKK